MSVLDDVTLNERLAKLYTLQGDKYNANEALE